MSPTRPVVGVSLKAYFDGPRLDAWLAEVATLADAASWTDDADVFVLPDLLGLAVAVRAFAGTGVQVGAQDVSSQDFGPTSGDVPAARLAEAGATIGMVGHAERRARHGETDSLVARKVARLVAAGLTPLVCVGETTPGAASAVDACVAQLRAALASVPDRGRVLVAYEPVWAIGAASPAAPEYVGEVVTGMRARVPRDLTVLYGGSAGPGVFAAVADVVDGLFLGRFAHRPTALADVVGEVRTRRAATKPS